MDANQSNTPFRVLQLIGNLDIGGAQEVVRTLSAYLTECGHKTIVCTFRDGPLRQEIERIDIPVEVLPGRRHSILSLPLFIADMLRIRRELANIIDRYEINVVQTHLLRSMDFLVLSLKLRFKQLLVFWTVHNAQFGLRADQISTRNRRLLRQKQGAHRLLYRTAAGLADGFIAVSDEVKNAVIQTIGPVETHITVISNGVDVRRYSPGGNRAAVRQSLGLDENSCLFLVIGTLKEQKGHRYLIEAIAPILANTPRFHVLFAGDGQLREPLQQQVRAAGLEKNIHFLGNRQDIPDLLAAADYFVLPSLWEGLPMALLEAMASGLPVVATEVSGSQQVVTHGETGILVPPGDAGALQKAISRLIADPAGARAMGLAAQARVEALFGARKQAEEHLQLYYREWRRENHNGR